MRQRLQQQQSTAPTAYCPPTATATDPGVFGVPGGDGIDGG